MQTITRQDYEACMERYADTIEMVRRNAHQLHESVRQTYGSELPYGYHLDMVVNNIRDFGHLVCVRKMCFPCSLEATITTASRMPG